MSVVSVVLCQVHASAIGPIACPEEAADCDVLVCNLETLAHVLLCQGRRRRRRFAIYTTGFKAKILRSAYTVLLCVWC
jgi:hypothetical protein